jgi:hypothetical protein
MTDPKSRDTEAVPTTAFLPDHLVAGGNAGIEAAAADEPTDDEPDDETDATSEFCRSWRSHLSGSDRKTPF